MTEFEERAKVEYMDITTGLIIYGVLGLVIAIFAEYQIAQALKDPLAQMLGLKQPTPFQRVLNALLIIIGWPIVLVKKIWERA